VLVLSIKNSISFPPYLVCYPCPVSYLKLHNKISPQGLSFHSYTFLLYTHMRHNFFHYYHTSQLFFSPFIYLFIVLSIFSLFFFSFFTCFVLSHSSLFAALYSPLYSMYSSLN